MENTKEVHEECIKLIRKFITPFKYDIPGYDTKFDPFLKDKENFSRLIKDCSLMAARSAELTVNVLATTFGKDKVANKKIVFLLRVRDQLGKIMDKTPRAVFNYYEKHNHTLLVL